MGDALQAAYDGVRRVRGGLEYGPDHGVESVAAQAVRARAQGGQVAGERDLARGGGVDGQAWLGGQGPARGRLEGGIAGEPAGRDRGRAGTDDCDDGSGRRSGGAHRPSVRARAPTGQWGGAGGRRVPVQPGCPYPRSFSSTSRTWSRVRSVGVWWGWALAVSQTRHSHSSWAVRS